MRVAIDSGPLSGGHSVRGIGTMVGEQIRYLRKESKKEKGRMLEIDAFDFGSESGRLKIEKGGFDIVHYPYFFPYALTLPQRKFGKKMIVTIQDLIHLIYPNKYPPGLRGRINFLKQKIRLKNVDAVITVSETSKKDIVRFLGIPAEKIHVTYLAPKKVFRRLEIGDRRLIEVRRKYNLPDKFVLYVGDVNYNKNIPNLITACRIAKIPLVICGKHALEIKGGGELKALGGPRDWIRFVFNIPHPELAHFEKLSAKLHKGVIRTGFVTDEELLAIYNLASVYVQASFYEGFGLPVLEAMACGVPVVVARTNALTEIADGAALVASPDSPREIADCILKILKDEKIKRHFVARGFGRVKDFSWEETAKKTIDFYLKVMRGSD